MPKQHLPKITQLVGAMVIKHDNCDEEDAHNGSEIGPDDTLVPGKNSSCVVRIYGQQLAAISKNKASEPATIRTRFPLAPPKPGSKLHLQASCIRTDTTLTLQAQREDAAGKIVVSNLRVKF